MNVLNCNLMGGAGNTLFQYCFARAFAERHRMDLRIPAWWGEKVFQIEHPHIAERFLDNQCNEETLEQAVGHREFKGYAQMQQCLELYTRTEAKKWLKFRPEILACLPSDFIGGPVCHVRRGDFGGYGYPLVSKQSYLDCLKNNALTEKPPIWISDDHPIHVPEFHNELEWLPDFWVLRKAKILLRANSSFSWWAHTLADDDQQVFSPVIEGLEGGREHLCAFKPGNAERLSDFPFVTRLELKP